MYFAPFGLGAYFANLIGDLGPSLIGDFGRTLVVYYPLIILYMLILFPIYAYYAGGKDGVRKMRQNILSPAVTAFGTQSSVATLPVNQKSCDRIGVPSDVSNLVLPMGATMHMDGSVISSIVKISFLFSIYKMDFIGVETYLMAIVVSILSAFVLSGAPGGGLVGEMLIISLFGFPQEAFPLIVTIGFLVDPGATMLNASGDTVASMMVARRTEGKDWIKKGRNEASA
jgi:Na+/H+-dicarboxylate symporter